jgi:tRNA threonylcarbamoyladenosine biosynthesis protein TsaB
VNILAIETATELVGVAVGDEGGVQCALWATGRRRHTETLAPAITQLLAHADLAVHDVDVIAVDHGPGLFTGLRVGVATAKGMAQGLGVPVIGLSGLAVLARAAEDAGHIGTVVSVIDARRGEVFVATYTVGLEDAAVGLIELDAPHVASPEELARHVAQLPTDDGPVLVVGDGALRYRDALSGLAHVRMAGPSLAAPPPSMLATLATEELAAGRVAQPAGAIQPFYLRQADAQINWVQREKVPS